jgi:hypothetical protein
LGVGHLRLGQGGLERVDGAIVGIDAHPQLRAGVPVGRGHGPKAGLQPHRQQQDRDLVVELADRLPRVADGRERLDGVSEHLRRLRPRLLRLRQAALRSGLRLPEPTPLRNMVLVARVEATVERCQQRLHLFDPLPCRERLVDSPGLLVAGVSQPLPEFLETRHGHRLARRFAYLGVNISLACTATSTGAWNST